jgi:hypothetical protein
MSIRSNAALAMWCPKFFIVILLLLCASGCDDQTAVPVTPAPSEPTLARMTFTLGGTSFAIFLPETATIHSPVSPDKVYIDLRKNSREQRVLILTTAPHDPGASYDQKKTLTNGGHLEYRTEDDTGGGMSGLIAELTGRMKIGSLVISVECTDQAKWSRKPEFCLPYLDRLEIVERSP